VGHSSAPRSRRAGAAAEVVSADASASPTRAELVTGLEGTVQWTLLTTLPISAPVSSGDAPYDIGTLPGLPYNILRPKSSARIGDIAITVAPQLATSLVLISLRAY
jgi:hypothetical protein